MKTKKRTTFFAAIFFVAAFIIWTVLLLFVDVKGVGQNGTNIGFATLNTYTHKLLGVNMTLYTITDWLGILPILFAIGFAAFGLFQWIKRKKISKVDKDILYLGGFFAAVMIVFIFFEFAVINYRPILIEGNLEASYPSSTTMLFTSVMPVVAMQFNKRIENKLLKRILIVSVITLTTFAVVARLFSGVHWLSDIIGGLLISAGLVLGYYSTLD